MKALIPIFLISILILSLLLHGCTNKEACKGIDEKAKCYAKIALKEGNASVCEEITDWPIAKASCYAEVAVGMNNKDICNLITYDPSFVNQCKDMVEKGKVIPWMVS